MTGLKNPKAQYVVFIVAMVLTVYCATLIFDQPWSAIVSMGAGGAVGWAVVMLVVEIRKGNEK